MIKTKPNPMSIATVCIFIILSILGIVYAIFVGEVVLRIFAIVLSILFFVLGTALGIGTFCNYEEASPEKMIIHRYFKTKEIKVSEIYLILFYGAYITLVDKNDCELCTISSNKSNLIPVLEVLEKNGVEIRDLTNQKNNSEE